MGLLRCARAALQVGPSQRLGGFPFRRLREGSSGLVAPLNRLVSELLGFGPGRLGDRQGRERVRAGCPFQIGAEPKRDGLVAVPVVGGLGILRFAGARGLFESPGGRTQLAVLVLQVRELPERMLDAALRVRELRLEDSESCRLLAVELLEPGKLRLKRLSA